MMDLDLARKFILDYLPAEGQGPVNEVFNVMKAQPMQILNSGLIMNHWKYFQQGESTHAIAAANGIICGFALAYCMHRDPEVAKQMQAWLDDKAKAQGENVVNFLHRKRN